MGDYTQNLWSDFWPFLNSWLTFPILELSACILKTGMSDLVALADC